ncbi:DNA methyltransferase [Actinomadura sp. 6N118]|uniref:DNA methyltransferase n=1 Tax=Actinomadura sp. 6N118 TaxID=3375151 RepID=UPI00379BA902
MRVPFFADESVRLYVGDAVQVVGELPPRSIDCVVTSPPHWGKRDNGAQGQYGLETTLDDYVARLVEVFTQLRRVLADAGTVWLNLGDSYAGSWGNYTATGSPANHRQSPVRHVPATTGRRASRATRQEPARAAVAGGVRATGRRLVPAQRSGVEQTQCDARVSHRPALLTLGTHLPAVPATPLLLRSERHPRPTDRPQLDRRQPQDQRCGQGGTPDKRGLFHTGFPPSR